MNISVYSRAKIEEIPKWAFPKNAAVISFGDTKEDMVDYKGKAERLFQIVLFDVDLDELEYFRINNDDFFPEVNDLAEFIYSAYNDGLNIICQCEYGQSRSAACAAAIKEHFYKNGIQIFANYKYCPNQIIYNMIFEALEKQKTLY